MASRSGSLWLLWAAWAATLPGWLAMPLVVAPRADPWYDAQIAVASFVCVILALVAAWGSFAVREALVLHDAPADATGVRGTVPLWLRFSALWGLCAAVGLLGGLMSYYASRPAVGWPYLIGAAVLLLLHAPGRRLRRRSQPE